VTTPAATEPVAATGHRRLRLPRPTIRLRLTLLYGSLFLASGAVLLTITYLLVSTGTPLVSTDASGRTVVTFSGVAGSVSGGGASTNGVGELIGPGPQDPVALQTIVLDQHAAELNQLLAWSLVALAIMAVVSVGAGWLVAGRVLQPLRSMTSDVRELSATSLHRRLVTDGPDDELCDLGATFNDLLARLDASFQAQRAFVANASHELRTPLARQRTVLQVALDDPDATIDSLRQAGARALVAGEQQERLIEALLMLARGERGLDHREPVDLGAVAGEVVQARQAEADGQGLRLRTRLGPAETRGDARLLERLVGNLVDNALRYNEPGGWVEVSTTGWRGSVHLSVVNSGPPVPPAEVGRLLEPFQRLAPERTGAGDGWGLGLSIVRAIVRAHGGTTDLRARPEGGLSIEVSLPAWGWSRTG
jgi:signal transduction histidine kinase